eukprot:scaffold15117_cov26-Tisochrysis_lutea.AAC.1
MQAHAQTQAHLTMLLLSPCVCTRHARAHVPVNSNGGCTSSEASCRILHSPAASFARHVPRHSIAQCRVNPAVLPFLSPSAHPCGSKPPKTCSCAQDEAFLAKLDPV